MVCPPPGLFFSVHTPTTVNRMKRPWAVGVENKHTGKFNIHLRYADEAKAREAARYAGTDQAGVEVRYLPMTDGVSADWYAGWEAAMDSVRLAVHENRQHVDYAADPDATWFPSKAECVERNGLNPGDTVYMRRVTISDPWTDTV